MARSPAGRLSVKKQSPKLALSSGVKSSKGPKTRTLSRTRKPDDMSLEQWQIELRRQYGREQKFALKKIGRESLFGDYEITNPETKKNYKIAVRSHEIGKNYCSCPDFATNGLGTCKHLEFVLATLENRPGFNKASPAVKTYSSLSLSYTEPCGVVFRPGSGCTPEIARLALRYFHADGRLRDGIDLELSRILDAATKAGHELRCYDDALLHLARQRDKILRLENIKKIFDKDIESAAFATLLKMPLHRYQCGGALFAARAGRAIIADEMGLGKTIQAIAATEILNRCAGVEKVLVIAPTSLKYQWQQEIANFSGREAQVIAGLRVKRHQAYAEGSFYKITNYDVIHHDRGAIRKWAPDLIILDEAQRIKNWQTRAARSVKELESEFALVLTGTPLENRIEELHSIVQFVDRFRLGPLFRFQHEHRDTDESGVVVGYKNLDHVAATLKPVLIRRTKKDVLNDLPKRSDKTFFVGMTPEQQEHHGENQEIVATVVAKWRRTGFLSEADQLRLRIALQNMRMSCNSTYLLDQKTDHGMKMDEALRFLTEALEEPDTKVVVFSQWIRTHELLIRRVEGKWGYVFFNGSVPGTQRKELIRRFKEDADCRLFLSTDAGGVGLNLQNASVVVNMDLPWNPAVLEQRIGRIHRLGQKNSVRVANFVAENTIEHGMINLLKFKTSLFAGVLDGGESTVSLGGGRLKKFMESVESVTTTIPDSWDVEKDDSPQGAITTDDNEKNDDCTDVAMDSDAGDSADSDSDGYDKVPDQEVTVPESPVASDDIWKDLATQGLQFLGKLAALAGDNKNSSDPSVQANDNPRPVFRIDRQSQRINMDLPMPSPQVINTIGHAVQTLADIFKKLSF